MEKDLENYFTFCRRKIDFKLIKKGEKSHRYKYKYLQKYRTGSIKSSKMFLSKRWSSLSISYLCILNRLHPYEIVCKNVKSTAFSVRQITIRNRTRFTVCIYHLINWNVAIWYNRTFSMNSSPPFFRSGNHDDADGEIWDSRQDFFLNFLRQSSDKMI